MIRKTIFLVDCFVHSEGIKEKLINRLKQLKERNFDVILASNRITLDQGILDNIDYLFYNKKNNLFSEEYTGIIPVDFWSNHGHFTSHTFSSGLQRHGLSVIINMLSSLKIAKQMGYTHFHKLEIDADFDKQGLDRILEIDRDIKSDKIDGVLYLHEPPGEFWKNGDLAFSYMSCDIDTFLNNFPEIGCEEDFRKFLMEKKGNLDFLIAEEFLYEIIRCKTTEKTILKKSVEGFKEDFPGTMWNTVTTPSISTSIEGVITGAYKSINANGEHIGFCVYSRSLADKETIREINVTNEDGSKFTITHNLPCNSSWCYNDLPESAKKIEIYSGGNVILSQNIKKEEISSYLQFH